MSKEVDIKRLEELRDFIKEKGANFYFADTKNAIIGYETIVNVLEYIKELEEGRDGIYADYQDLGKAYYDSIPKQKIRDKIEEKQKRINKMHPGSDCVLIDDLDNQIQVLNELLEEE